MKKICFYLRADIKRLLCSARLVMSVLLTVGVLLLASLEEIYWDAGVLYVFSLVMYGMLAGILSLWSSYLSFYISNRMLVLAAPMILYYFTDYLLTGIFPGKVNLGLIFSASNNLFLNDFLAVFVVAVMVFVNFILLKPLMTWKIRRKIYE